MNTKYNILIIKHGSFGDLIRAGFIINAIKKFHKNSNLILLTSNIYSSLMKKNPDIKDVVIDNRESFFNISYLMKLRKKLLAYKFILIYDLQNSQRTFLYKKFLLSNHKWITTDREKHPISGLRGLADMLKRAQIKFNDTLKSDISWMIYDVQKILSKLNIKNKFILIIPGSSKKNAYKRWPYFDDLISLLLKKKFEVVTILGPEELDLENKLNGKILKNLCWEEVSGIIQKSRFIISNDTGAIHIAACLNKNGLVFYGKKKNPTIAELNYNNFISIQSDNLYELSAEKIYKNFLEDKLY